MTDDRAIARADVGESRNERREDIVESIVDAAMRLFESNGVKKTSITQIMAEVGITRELFYYYFGGGKNELIEKVIDKYIQMLLDDVRAKIADSESGQSLTPGDMMDTIRNFFLSGASREPPISIDNPMTRFDVIGEVGLGKRMADTIVSELLEISGTNSWIKNTGDGAPDRVVIEFCLMGMLGIAILEPKIDVDDFDKSIDAFFRNQYRD